MLLYDVDNDYIINCLNLINNKFTSNHFRCISLITSPKIYKKCNNNFKFYNSSKINFKILLKIFNDFIKLNTILSKYHVLFSQNGLSSKFIKYVQIQILSLVYESHCIKKNLELINPKIIILGNDCHRTSRLFVQHSRSLNIKSFVVQHGFTTWKYGYLPLHADFIFVWGKFFKDWFITNNTDPNRVFISGNPLYKEDFINHNVNKDYRTVYIFTNPIDACVLKIVLKKIAKLKFPLDSSVILKLHPNEKLRDYHNQFIRSVCSERAVISKVPLNQLDISVGDIAININSTAGFDACVMGAYVLSINFNSYPKTVDYELYNLGINTSLHDLDLNFSKILKLNKNMHHKYLLKFITDFIGRMNSLEIIYNQILKITSLR